jgi:hypothetical protein
LARRGTSPRRTRRHRSGSEGQQCPFQRRPSSSDPQTVQRDDPRREVRPPDARWFQTPAGSRLAKLRFAKLRSSDPRATSRVEVTTPDRVVIRTPPCPPCRSAIWIHGSRETTRDHTTRAAHAPPRAMHVLPIDPLNRWDACIPHSRHSPSASPTKALRTTRAHAHPAAAPTTPAQQPRHPQDIPRQPGLAQHPRAAPSRSTRAAPPIAAGPGARAHTFRAAPSPAPPRPALHIPRRICLRRIPRTA